MVAEIPIGRDIGSPLAPALAAIASAVILLSSGPTVMIASMAGSRAISAIWFAPNCVIVTFSGLIPDSVRMLRSSVAFSGVRPITPTRRPARPTISLILAVGPFLAHLGL